MTLKITELGGGMARAGLPANHANITNAKTMTSEILARVGFNTKTEGDEV
jgi:hypothetical protein